jgi:hypothetical protein
MQQKVDYLFLSVADHDWCLLESPPECFLFQDAARQYICFFNCATQAAEEPSQPIGYVPPALLGIFKNLVVAPALFADLGRHTVEALCAVLQSS